MAEKYSIPENYAVQQFGNALGIVRAGKKESKWIWEPFYNILLIAKTYGKNLVAYREITNTENYLTIANYNKTKILPIKVYDIMFGESSLYVRTDNRSTGDIEWALVNEDLSGIKFLGDFEVIDRAANPSYIPVGTLELKIRTEDGAEKKLTVSSGEITECYTKKVEKVEKVEEPLTEYKVVINADTKRIQMLGKNGRVIKESYQIGELEQYVDLIGAMLGGSTVIPVKTGDLLIEFLQHFESHVHGMVLPILYTYEKDRSTEKKSLDERLKDMINEIKSGWFKWENKEFKVYIRGTIFLAMMREPGRRITVAPYMISTDNNIFTQEEFEALLKVYQMNGFKSTKLKLDDIEVLEVITDESETSQYPSPYSVKQRLGMAKGIKKYSYGKISEVELKGHLESESKHNAGELSITLSICEEFKYFQKLKNYKISNGEVTTNISAIQIA